MTQDRIDATVAGMLVAGFGRGLKDLYRDLRDGADGCDASYNMVVACKRASLDHGKEGLPGAFRWWRIFNRLNDVVLPVIVGL